MNMAVDAARKRQQVRCIDLVRRSLDTVCDADDTAVANSDIGPEFVARSGYRAASNGEIKLCHVKCLPID